MRWPVKIALAVLLLTIVVVAGLWINRPSIHLKITRRAVEQGKPVVFFQLEGAGTKSILNVSRVGPNLHDHGFLPMGPDYSGPAPDFWAPSEGGVPLVFSQKTFGVLAPTNTVVWRLRVVVRTQVAHSWRNMALIPRVLGKDLIKNPLQARKAIIFFWNYPMEKFETIDSEPIINTVTPT